MTPSYSPFVVITTLVTLALASPKAVGARDQLSTITLTDPPLITEVVPFFIKTETTIDQPGVHTLGLDCLALIGFNCLAEVTDVLEPTVGTLTGIGTRTTSYPISSPTTYTSSTYDVGCGCHHSTVYCWTPAPYPTCPPSVSESSVTVTKTTSVPTTVTTTITSTATASCQPSLTCDKYGYLIQDVTLFRVDLVTGRYTTVAKTVGNGKSINGMGYNTLDNYLYALQGATQLIRISSDGKAENIAQFKSVSGANVGDIDTDGYYWFGSGGKTWFQADLNPQSPSYGTLVANGTMGALGLAIADWAYIPVGGAYMYSVGHNTTQGGGTTLIRFSLDTKEWEVIERYPTVGGHTWGAMYGINNGTLYASDNTNGQIWAFPIEGGTPYMASQGPESGSNDGARCVLNILEN
ncbi:hypothetical protein F4809DRAFT_587703 [Biscogniauxia mediterranea]|nr:hypothetical protein F4809DRAFT_587703 [Biscogniauxia mediterranea]